MHFSTIRDALGRAEFHRVLPRQAPDANECKPTLRANAMIEKSVDVDTVVALKRDDRTEDTVINTASASPARASAMGGCVAGVGSGARAKPSQKKEPKRAMRASGDRQHDARDANMPARRGLVGRPDRTKPRP